MRTLIFIAVSIIAATSFAEDKKILLSFEGYSDFKKINIYHKRDDVMSGFDEGFSDLDRTIDVTLNNNSTIQVVIPEVIYFAIYSLAHMQDWRLQMVDPIYETFHRDKVCKMIVQNFEKIQIGIFPRGKVEPAVTIQAHDNCASNQGVKLLNLNIRDKVNYVRGMLVGFLVSNSHINED